MVASAGLSWNVLDFGVSWFTARQNADRYLIVDERRRKAVFTLVQEVQVAYWRAYAHQLMSERISTVVADARVALANAQQIEVEQIQSPLETLRYQKSLLENLRQLWQIEQELVSARAELASLMTLPPGSNFRLAPVEKEKIGPLPDDFSIEQLEQIAFQNNPDIREQTYQSRISAQEARKAILKMLPGISFNVSRQYDSNSFLVDNQWYESSAKLSWNLLSLLSVDRKSTRLNSSH